jgi:hypothetical protein
VGDLIDPPPNRLQVSEKDPLVFLVTLHGDFSNGLVRLGEQVGEAGITPRHLMGPRLVGDGDEAPTGIVMPGNPSVPGVDQILEGEDSGVLPSQHVVFGEVVDSGRVVEQSGPFHHREGAATKRDPGRVQVNRPRMTEEHRLILPKSVRRCGVGWGWRFGGR